MLPDFGVDGIIRSQEGHDLIPRHCGEGQPLPDLPFPYGITLDSMLY